MKDTARKIGKRAVNSESDTFVVEPDGTGVDTVMRVNVRDMASAFAHCEVVELRSVTLCVFTGKLDSGDDIMICDGHEAVTFSPVLMRSMESRSITLYVPGRFASVLQRVCV